MKLQEYVLENTNRGSCQCGRCIDAPDVATHPEGHTINLSFFEVAVYGNKATKEEFLKLVEVEYPHWLDGKEHSYLEVGGDMDDQGIALMTIGLGHLLGAWKCLCPETMMPFLPNDLKMEMAGRGMVSLKYN
jgi:hypothetical protein